MAVETVDRLSGTVGVRVHAHKTIAEESEADSTFFALSFIFESLLSDSFYFARAVLSDSDLGNPAW